MALFELMIVNSAIRNIIRSGDMTQMYNAIQSGRSSGMIDMESYAKVMIEQGLVRAEDCIGFFRTE